MTLPTNWIGSHSIQILDGHRYMYWTAGHLVVSTTIKLGTQSEPWNARAFLRIDVAVCQRFYWIGSEFLAILRRYKISLWRFSTVSEYGFVPLGHLALCKNSSSSKSLKGITEASVTHFYISLSLGPTLCQGSTSPSMKHSECKLKMFLVVTILWQALVEQPPITSEVRWRSLVECVYYDWFIVM
jgi:hypothetical protein